MPIGAGRLYLESKENCLRLHTAMGDAAVEEGCRMVRKLRDSARRETSMVQTLKTTLVNAVQEFGQRYRLIVDGVVILSKLQVVCHRQANAKNKTIVGAICHGKGSTKKTSRPILRRAQRLIAFVKNLPNCKSYCAINASHCEDECPISEAADNGIVVHAASMPALEQTSSPVVARTKKTWQFHAQSYSDVIDVVDTRSFEVKGKKITFDIRRPCIHMPLRRTKHARVY